MTDQLRDLVEGIVQQVAELPDRTSPDEWPEAMLVTADELTSILQAALQASADLPRSLEGLEEAPRCQLCGGEHFFDTVVPSVVWNDVIRANGIPEFLCASCIIREFAKRNTGFTCELWGAEFSGTPIAVHVNARRARDSQRLSAENTDLRHRLQEAERACHRLREERDQFVAESKGLEAALRQTAERK